MQNWSDHSCWFIRGTELDKRHHKYRSVQSPPPSTWLVELRYFVSNSLLTSHLMIVKQNWCLNFQSCLRSPMWYFSLTQWGSEAVVYNEFGFDLSCSDLFPVVIQHYFTTNQTELLAFFFLIQSLYKVYIYIKNL